MRTGRYHPYGGGSAGPSGSNAYASGSGSYDYGYGTGANGSSGGGGGSSYGYGGVGAGPSNVPAWDPDIAQQSSIYTPEAAERGNYKQHRENASGKKGGQGGGGGKSRTTVLRKGAGELWEDPTLLEWDPKHFRLFVGNLDPALSDDTFQQAFAKYPSLVKAKIVRDKNSKKCKGYGFVAYSDPEDFLKAWKELNGALRSRLPRSLSLSLHRLTVLSSFV